MGDFFRMSARGLWRFIAAVICALPLAAGAAVTVAPLFSDNMILQRDTRVPVWGKAALGEAVRIVFGGQTKETTAGVDGRWSVTLDPMKASSSPATLSVNGMRFTNVLVGEVWICSGQSNMEMGIKLAADADREIAGADNPQMRLFMVDNKFAIKPCDELHGEKWKVCTPASVTEGGWNWGGFSALGYFFGRELQKRLGVPVGVIEVDWAGSWAQAWTPVTALRAKPIYATYVAQYDDALEYGFMTEDSAQGKSKAPDTRSGANHPKFRAAPVIAQNVPSALYNAMLAPVIPYAIRGVVWYQGESNTEKAHEYRTLFPDMIKAWRAAWGQGDFPFYFVQLANFYPRKTGPAESGWAELREAQTMALSLPNTGMAVAIDIGEANDIHPKNKQEVGRRLARNALAGTYGFNIESCGPLFRSMVARGGKVILSFSHVGSGLACNGDTLKGFAICGADRVFVWADARINRNTVVVSSPKVGKPVAVRYAWTENPECNLYNREGLPASPFRTDSFKGVTEH